MRVTPVHGKPGSDGAMPGLMMPGTPLLGAKYFQEIAPPDAVDRGEIAEMGLDVEVPAGELVRAVLKSSTPTQRRTVNVVRRC